MPEISIHNLTAQSCTGGSKGSHPYFRSSNKFLYTFIKVSGSTKFVISEISSSDGSSCLAPQTLSGVYVNYSLSFTILHSNIGSFDIKSPNSSSFAIFSPDKLRDDEFVSLAIAVQLPGRPIKLSSST